MKDALIVAGIVAVGWYLLKQRANAIAAAPPSIPTALGVSTAPSVSGAYQVPSAATQLAPGYNLLSPDAGPVTYVAPLPNVPPPPPYYGGTAGGAGSGGNPLGGQLRAGVSSGTGTTLSLSRSGRGHF